MITRDNCVLRFSEYDDATFLRNLYLTGEPKAALFDMRRELGMPTVNEIEEVLTKAEQSRAFLFTVEDLEGRRIGWCGLRGLNIESRFCELFIVFSSSAIYAGPIVSEVLETLLQRAFQQVGLQRVFVTVLDEETTYRARLIDSGFRSCGVQRDAFFGNGKWHDLETFELENPTMSGQAVLVQGGEKGV